MDMSEGAHTDTHIQTHTQERKRLLMLREVLFPAGKNLVQWKIVAIGKHYPAGLQGL